MPTLLTKAFLIPQSLAVAVPMLDTTAEVAQMRKHFLYHSNQQRSVKHTAQLAHRRFRSQVYNFLERPNNTLGFLYHTDLDKQLLDSIHYMEIFLAIYFFLEFLARLWAVGANGKYQGLIGRLIYLRRPVCLIDVLVLSATFFVVLMEQSFVSNATVIEKLRFLQILRLFHIDRQMTAWKLIKKMVQRSKFELISAYYITFIVLLTLAVLVYNIETTLPTFPSTNLTSNSSLDASIPKSLAIFANFGESFWFSIVSVLTIGYGDIVPKQWQSKLVVCLLSYVGLSLFSAASGLVGVGMSLMLHNQHREKKQGKIKHLAACTIQTWYRFHLISNQERFMSIPAYRKYCVKLQQVEERLRKGRILLKRASERRTVKRSLRLPKVLKRKALAEEMYHHDPASAESKVTKSLLKAATHMDRPSSLLLNTHRSPSPTSSLRKMLLDPELSPSVSIKRAAFESHRRSSALPLLRSNVFMDSFRRSSDWGENDLTSETTSIMSLDLSDDEKLLDYYYYCQPYRSHSNSQHSQDNSMFDESLTGHYRCILRMVYFFLFITTLKRFKRARKPYEMMDAEAELCEMEHQNSQKFKELEMRLEATIGGKPMPSALQLQPQQEEVNAINNPSASIQQRLQSCESKLVDVEKKAKFVEHLAGLIFKNMQHKDPLKVQPLNLEAKFHGSMLPPASPRVKSPARH